MKKDYKFIDIKKKSLILIAILLVCYFTIGNIFSLLFTAISGQELTVIQKEIVVWVIDIVTTILLIFSLRYFIADSFSDLKTKGIKNLLLWIFIGFLLQLLLSTVGSSIMVVIVLKGGVNLSFNNQTAINSMLKDSYILNFISLVIIAPFVEELFFRAFVFRVLKNKLILSIMLSSLFFGTAHVIGEIIHGEFVVASVTMIIYAFSGLGLAILYAKRKNILVPMFVHMIWNFLSFSLNLLKDLII